MQCRYSGLCLFWNTDSVDLITDQRGYDGRQPLYGWGWILQCL
jgi:hypothetical protein